MSWDDETGLEEVFNSWPEPGLRLTGQQVWWPAKCSIVRTDTVFDKEWRCEEQPETMAPWPLCPKHLKEMAEWVTPLYHASLLSDNDKVVRKAVHHARREWRQKDAGQVIRSVVPQIAQVVYFLQRADQDIKIGYTEDMRQRQRDLTRQFGPLVLLGCIQGDKRVEDEMHGRFREARIGKTEWFTPTPFLLGFIDRLSAVHDETPAA